ncbi:unnamed protein product [Ambrosiozyma monospora]|uniref:Unnamed protein product n=1 Tax=Ambrosiozyma monospora TaxID=43982 RepID=A0ACB5STR5_AMBMO|nr:unnamed protein product [Ambrosiozyma monospora]
MTHYLKSLNKGNLCVVLEGGYNLDSIAKSALRVAKVLLGEPPEELKDMTPKSETIEVIDDVIKIQSRYWKSLKPGYYGRDFNLTSIMGEPENLAKSATGPTFEEMALAHERVNDSVRTHQKKTLFDNNNFVALPIVSEKRDEASLQNEILCTKDIYDADRIIIIIHDPSRIWSRRDPVTGDLDTSQSVVVDQSQRFIDWAQKEHFGIIDVNIPLTITGENELNYNNITSSQDALLYLWDNYIQYFKVSKIAFVGVGDAYNGVVHLCGHRDVRTLVKASINFLDKPTALRAVVSTIDESVTDWFYRNSLVFTSHKHPCWGDIEKNGSNQKRPRKKYGRVIRADVENLDSVIDERFEEACDFILDSVEDYETESESE